MSEILLEHGDGGLLTSRLVKELFLKHLGPPKGPLEDSTIVESPPRIAVTTDAFVVSPLRFRGGDIGKLAVSGTYNDLVVRGARPAYLTCSFIIEEGFEIARLEELVESLAAEASRARISVIAGDTKVVRAGQADFTAHWNRMRGTTPAHLSAHAANRILQEIGHEKGRQRDHRPRRNTGHT